MEFSALTTHTPTDWEQWATSNIEIHNGGIELAAAPSLSTRQLSQTAIDIAVDAAGNRYLLEQSGVITRHNSHRGIEHRLWQPEESGLTNPQSLSVSDGRLYVVDEAGSVAIFETRLQQPIGTVETDTETPVRVTAVDGECYLLAVTAGEINRLRSDGSLQTVFETTGTRSVRDMALTECGKLYALETRVDDGAIEAYESTGDRLSRSRRRGSQRRIRTQSLDDEPDNELNSKTFPITTFETDCGASLTPHRIATGVDATLLVAGTTEHGESVLATLDVDSSTLTTRQQFDTACVGLTTPVADTDGASYAVFESGCVRLKPTETYVRGPDGQYRGVAYRQFDAGSTAIQWHRLALGCAQIGGETRLSVDYFASDESSPLAEPLSAVSGLPASLLATLGVETAWELLAIEPTEITAHADSVTRSEAQNALDAVQTAIETATDGHWKTADATEDILLSAASGRYLTVRLELVGTRRASPRINTLAASWPRQSYLEYLPELYQDSESDAFLRDFLSVFGTLFTDIERTVETTTEYFDPDATPAAALPWLAEWIGIEIPDEWPTAAARTLVSAGPQRHRSRGTKDGLRNMLGLYLSHISPGEPLPSDRLVPSKPSQMGMEIEMDAVDHGLCILDGEAVALLPSSTPTADGQPSTHRQRVVVYAGPFAEPAHRTAVERIIERETPAHVEGHLIELEPEFRLGTETVLGTNSRLNSRSFELSGTRLGETAVLATDSRQ